MGLLNFVVILFTVFLSACAQLMLKMGAAATLGVGQPSTPYELVVKVMFSPLILSGIFTYGVSVLIWIWVLSRVELSIAYPFVGLSFIFTLLFGMFFLGEAVNFSKIIGTLMIVGGCIFIANSAAS
ncbi:small multi-drug resistant family protein [Saccharophagus sp. K07]|uniref:EamA family transporter n=1 Tax=Saccharophagus sp. K07 TaxID=2283636 RepID=UPI0016529B03|nr:EamA family transporter [Saccharophagus sp. K07]MBC6907154.1 small multi-drug resistant family protein [Saccharophagus sp. K07]